MCRKSPRARKLEDRLAECNLTARPVDLAGALFLYCGFTDEDHRQRLPGALERLEAIAISMRRAAHRTGTPPARFSSCCEWKKRRPDRAAIPDLSSGLRISCRSGHTVLLCPYRTNSAPRI